MVHHTQPHGVRGGRVLLERHPLVALGGTGVHGKTGLTVVGHVVPVDVAVHRLVGGSEGRGGGAGVKCHVTVWRRVEAAALEVGQVLEGWRAHGRAGGLQGEQVGAGAWGQAARGAGQKAFRRVSLLRGRQLGADKAGRMGHGHGHGGHSRGVHIFSELLLY